MQHWDIGLYSCVDSESEMSWVTFFRLRLNSCSTL